MSVRKRIYRLSVRAVVVISLGSSWTGVYGQTRNKAEVYLEVGQPSIWSLAQAHYLLASMRENNRGLAVTPPTLNPNEVNGLRADILTQVFGADLEFSGPVGLQNQMAARQFQSDLAAKQTARTRLGERSNERQAVYDQMGRNSRKLVSLQAQQAEISAIPADQRTDAQSNQLVELNQRITALNAEQSLLTTQKTALDAEIGDLSQQATASPGTGVPTLLSANASSPAIGGGNGYPLTNNVSNLVGKIAGGSPSLAASTQLDNYIQMQYELISKQLTLLRDEVGAGKKLVFLELPTSVYTVPGKSDDYLIKTDWHVSRYYGPKADELTPTLQDEVSRMEEPNSEPLTLETIRQFDLKRERLVNDLMSHGLKTDQPINDLTQVARIYKAAAPDAQLEAASTYLKQKGLTGSDAEMKTHVDNVLAVVDRESRLLGKQWFTIDSTTRPQFRTLDVIPHQSALNINDANGKSTGLNLLAGFQWLSGIGAKVSYQRQREIYQQFVHQESFATGFGKGLDKFGWTFGPVPGTNRIAPGTRSTYAVLEVPDKVLALTLSVKATGFKKKESPEDKALQIDLAQRDFNLRVPDDDVAGFWVNGVSYTPVPPGQRVTAVLHGRYFSPQIGILVNGSPLSRAVSIGKNESLSTMIQTGAQGEYEYVSPTEIIMSFSMGADFAGTPLITMVTPEKTDTINNFKLTIDGEAGQQLSELSKTKPMFLRKLAIADVQIEARDDGTRLLRLIGDGFLKSGDVSINGIEIPLPAQANLAPGIALQSCAGAAPARLPCIDTSRYALLIDNATYNRIARAGENPDMSHDQDGKWLVRYRQPTRLGYAEASYLLSRPNESEYDTLNYSPGPRKGTWMMDLSVAIAGENPVATPENPDDIEVLAPPARTSTGLYLIRLLLKNDKDNQTLRIRNDAGLETPLIVERPEAPAIDQVVNAQTGKPEGDADSAQLIKITGKHLGHLAQVKLDSTEVQIVAADEGIVIVQAPAMPAGKVHVYLRSRLKVRGRPVTNVADFNNPNRAIYTFKKSGK